MIEPIVTCAAGLDVHQGSVTCTVLEEQGPGGKPGNMTLVPGG